MFGGGTFNDLSRHPDRVVRGNGYSSAAAGAYQFLPGTWQAQSSRLGLKGFGPAEQDVAALALARNRLMDLGGLETVRKEGLSQRVASALSPEWASFPTETGRSYYGQPVKSLGELQKYYGAAPVTAPAPVAASASSSAATPPPPVSSVLSSIFGGNLNPTEEKKSFAQSFVEQTIQGLLSSNKLIPAQTNPFFR
jgi:lysozyme